MRLPYARVEFTTKGDVADGRQVDAAVRLAREHGASDVLLLAHGWNNDIPAAESLFTRLGDHLAVDALVTARRIVVVGLLWPSVRWADDDAIAGGGVAIDDPRMQLDAAIAGSVEDPDVAAALRASADRLDATGEGQEDFMAALRSLLPPDADADDDEDAVPTALAAGDARSVFAAAEEVLLLGGDDEPGDVPTAELPPGVAPDLLAGAAVVGAGLELGSVLRVARLVLNTTTYYTMKDRAGKVGSRGVLTVLRRLHDGAPAARLHLGGHSFGARVVSAAAAGTDVPLDSVTLLQGAFSHYGFAHNYAGTAKDGVFRAALTSGRLHGPLVVTHTHNDRAVRSAYAVASRIARQTGAALGDRQDLYGGIGANGALATAEARAAELQESTHRYSFEAGHVYNLLADRFVVGHNAVTGPEVAHAMASAMTASA